MPSARLEPHAGHADRLLDAVLVVDDEFLRKDVQDLLIRRDRDRARRVDHALDVARRHLAVLDRDDAVRVEAADVAARNAGVHRLDLHVRHQLGFLHRALDGLDGGLDVDDDALLEAARRVRAQADDLYLVVALGEPDDRDHLRGPDVEADDDVLVAFAGHQACPLPLVGRAGRAAGFSAGASASTGGGSRTTARPCG